MHMEEVWPHQDELFCLPQWDHRACKVPSTSKLLKVLSKDTDFTQPWVQSLALDHLALEAFFPIKLWQHYHSSMSTESKSASSFPPLFLSLLLLEFLHSRIDYDKDCDGDVQVKNVGVIIRYNQTEKCIFLWLI